MTLFEVDLEDVYSWTLFEYSRRDQTISHFFDRVRDSELFGEYSLLKKYIRKIFDARLFFLDNHSMICDEFFEISFEKSLILILWKIYADPFLVESDFVLLCESDEIVFIPARRRSFSLYIERVPESWITLEDLDVFHFSRFLSSGHKCCEVVRPCLHFIVCLFRVCRRELFARFIIRDVAKRVSDVDSIRDRLESDGHFVPVLVQKEDFLFGFCRVDIDRRDSVAFREEVPESDSYCIFRVQDKRLERLSLLEFYESIFDVCFDLSVDPGKF